jgi:hypothetical protein
LKVLIISNWFVINRQTKLVCQALRKGGLACGPVNACILFYLCEKIY